MVLREHLNIILKDLIICELKMLNLLMMAHGSSFLVKQRKKGFLLPFSTLYLSEWLRSHPDPSPNNWLWVTLGKENYGSQVDLMRLECF